MKLTHELNRVMHRIRMQLQRYEGDYILKYYEKNIY